MSANGDKRELREAVALITGGGSGVGAAVAALLAAAGVRLFLVGRDMEKLRRVRDTVAPAAANFLPGDIGNPEFCAAAVAAVEECYGRLDILVNSAGAMHRATATETANADWARLMRTNVDGVFYCSRDAAMLMRRQGTGGAIVNVGSTLSLVGAPRLAAYCVSKGAVAQLTRAMALECAADGINVNAVCPGAIDSPMLYSAHTDGSTAAAVKTRNEVMIPLQKIASAEAVARAIIFLATEKHITGTLLSVDGGYVAQ